MADGTDDLLAELDTVLSSEKNQPELSDTGSTCNLSEKDDLSLRGIKIEDDTSKCDDYSKVTVDEDTSSQKSFDEQKTTAIQPVLSNYFTSSGAENDEDDFFASLAQRENFDESKVSKDVEADKDEITVIRHRTISSTSEPSSADISALHTAEINTGDFSHGNYNKDQTPISMPSLSTVTDYLEQEEEMKNVMDRVISNSGEPSEGATRRKSRVRFLEEEMESDSGSEIAGYGEVWLPSEAVRQVLMGINNRTINLQTLDPRFFTRPGLLNSDLQGDPIKTLLIKQSGESGAHIRQIMTADHVTQDISGIRDLLNDGWYRPAIDLTGRLLTACGHGFGKQGQSGSKLTASSLQLWLIRFALLIKTRQFAMVESEMTAFGNMDNPDMYYEFHAEQSPKKKGCMVPFSLRLIHAELPHFLGKFQDSFDRLYYLKEVIGRILTNLKNGYAEDGSQCKQSSENVEASIKLWQEREIKVLYSVLNICITYKDYPSAIELTHNLIAKSPQQRTHLISLLGRIYMQLGDLESASCCFEQSVANLDKSSDSVKAKIAFQKALLFIGRNNFDDAKRYFKECIDLDPTNALAINNFSVCCLYLGQLHEAIRILETLLKDRYTHDMLVFNLCTLYELESSRALSKKVKVLEHLAKIPGEPVAISSIKIGP